MPLYRKNSSVTVTEAGIRVVLSDSTRETLNFTNLGTSRVSIVDTLNNPETEGYPIPADGFLNYTLLWSDATKGTVIMKSIAGGGNIDVRVQETFKEAYN